MPLERHHGEPGAVEVDRCLQVVDPHAHVAHAAYARVGQSTRVPARSDDAALAANWKLIILVDVALGVAVLGAGLVALATGSVVVGGFLVAAGGSYVAAGWRRRSRWRRLRLEAGLDG